MNPFKKRVQKAEKFERLRQVSEAIDAHDAVGLWWAHQARSPLRGSVRVEFPQDVQEAIAPHLARFALELANRSRERDGDLFRADYVADRVFGEAATAAGMPFDPRASLSWKSYTRVDGDVAVAKLGDGAEEQQIWPPLETPIELS